MHYLVKQ